MGSTPDRSLEQRRAALVEANRIRTHRKLVKRDLKAGRREPADVLVDPDCATMKLYDLLLALPKMGRAKVDRLIRTARISPSKTVGGLSRRQREELAAAIPTLTPYAQRARLARQASTTRRTDK